MSFEHLDIEKELEKKKTQIRRGVLELCILSIISQEEVYPTDIIMKLKEFELIVKEGTLYPLLTRLKNAGLVRYEWKEGLGAGPPRKYFYITETGSEFLQGLLGTWNQLVLAVNQSTKALTKTKSKRTK